MLAITRKYFDEISSDYRYINEAGEAFVLRFIKDRGTVLCPVQIVDRDKLFGLGQVVATPGAASTVPTEALARCLTRHSQGDWGTLDDHDFDANNEALRTGERLLSSYIIQGPAIGEINLWIITEADRSVTTLLLPSEY